MAVHYNPAGLATIGGTAFMVGNRFSHNGYSYTRAPTLDWGNAPGGVAPTVTFDQVSNGKPWQAAEPLLAVASNLGLRDFGFALAAFAAPGASNLTFPPERRPALHDARARGDHPQLRRQRGLEASRRVRRRRDARVDRTCRASTTRW